MNVYIASPFFNEKQLDETIRVELACDDANWDYYSPRLGSISKEYAKLNANIIDPYIIYLYKNMVFAEDILEIDKADAVFVNYDGKDSGTLFELGYALASNKLIICSSTDPKVRAEFRETLSIFKAIIPNLEYKEDSFMCYFKNGEFNSTYTDEDSTIMVVAEYEKNNYRGLSKIILGYLYYKYKDRLTIKYIDIPRKSNLMLTSSVNVYECDNIKNLLSSILDSDDFIEISDFCKPVGEESKDE